MPFGDARMYFFCPRIRNLTGGNVGKTEIYLDFGILTVGAYAVFGYTNPQCSAFRDTAFAP